MSKNINIVSKLKRASMDGAVKQFFKEFQEASQNFNAEKSAQQFAKVFLHSDPENVRAVTNEQFVKSLEMRKVFFTSIGLKKSITVPIDALELGDDHVLVRTAVDMQFDKNGKTIDLHQTASYLLKRRHGSFVIIAYINDQLLTQILAENGISIS